MKNQRFLLKWLPDFYSAPDIAALISIFIAVSSLSYNTWRNEKTEANRNQRVAAFEILIKLGELQQVVFHHHYDQDSTDKGNPRTG